MQISATTSIQSIGPLDRQAADAQSQAKAYNATAALKQAEQDIVAPKVFTPAPPLRPSVQDVVDIDRALIQLGQA